MLAPLQCTHILPQVLELPKETFITALHWYPSQAGGARKSGASELCALGTTNGEERGGEEGRGGEQWGRDGVEENGRERWSTIVCMYIAVWCMKEEENTYMRVLCSSWGEYR